MAFRILLYFFLLAVGWLLSNKGYIHEKLIAKISNIQTLFLFLLIFIMGIRLGMNEQVVSSIGQIGFKSVIFTLFTAGFSVLFVFIIRKRFITDESVTGGK
nr:LysO family transporter [Sedimentibacter sp.]